MFIRIIDTESKHEHFIECSNILFNSMDKSIFQLDVQNKVDWTTYDIDKTKTELYIMNNEGKTIDKYRWEV